MPLIDKTQNAEKLAHALFLLCSSGRGTDECVRPHTSKSRRPSAYADFVKPLSALTFRLNRDTFSAHVGALLPALGCVCGLLRPTLSPTCCSAGVRATPGLRMLWFRWFTKNCEGSRASVWPDREVTIPCNPPRWCTRPICDWCGPKESRGRTGHTSSRWRRGSCDTSWWIIPGVGGPPSVAEGL